MNKSLFSKKIQQSQITTMSLTKNHGESALNDLLVAVNQMHKKLNRCVNTNFTVPKASKSEKNISDGFLNTIGVDGIHKMNKLFDSRIEALQRIN